jgi:hypothetical protein
MLLVLNSYDIYHKIQTYAQGHENPISYSAVEDIMHLGDKSTIFKIFFSKSRLTQEDHVV